MTYPNPNEIQTDKHYFLPVIDGIKQFDLKARTQQEVIENCERFEVAIDSGIEIEGFWGSEYL